MKKEKLKGVVPPLKNDLKIGDVIFWRWKGNNREYLKTEILNKNEQFVYIYNGSNNRWINIEDIDFAKA